jgi:hypothetical protein
MKNHLGPSLHCTKISVELELLEAYPMCALKQHDTEIRVSIAVAQCHARRCLYRVPERFLKQSCILETRAIAGHVESFSEF